MCPLGARTEFQELSTFTGGLPKRYSRTSSCGRCMLALGVLKASSLHAASGDGKGAGSFRQVEPQCGLLIRPAVCPVARPSSSCGTKVEAAVVAARDEDPFVRDVVRGLAHP